MMVLKGHPERWIEAFGAELGQISKFVTNEFHSRQPGPMFDIIFFSTLLGIPH